MDEREVDGVGRQLTTAGQLPRQVTVAVRQPKSELLGKIERCCWILKHFFQPVGHNDPVWPPVLDYIRASRY